MSNTHLNQARQSKNDEYYTKFYDVDKELSHYEAFLRGKHIYLPCDDSNSAFWKFFTANANAWGISITATSYRPGARGIRLDFSDGSMSQSLLDGDGDFLSEECIDIARQCDVVITNPPFSLIRRYMGMLMCERVDFILVAPTHFVINKDVIPYLLDGTIRIGHAGIHQMIFATPSEEKSVSCVWLTSFEISRDIPSIGLSKTTASNSYDTYDNFNAINIPRCKDIPADFDGAMGVPITILNFCEPSCGKLLVHAHDARGDVCFDVLGRDTEIAPHEATLEKGVLQIRGKNKFHRLIIKKQPDMLFEVLGLDRQIAPREALTRKTLSVDGSMVFTRCIIQKKGKENV